MEGLKVYLDYNCGNTSFESQVLLHNAKHWTSRASLCISFSLSSLSYYSFCFLFLLHLALDTSPVTYKILDIKFTSKFSPLISADAFTFYMLLNFASSTLTWKPKYLKKEFSVSRFRAPWSKEQKEHVAIPTTHLALAELNIKMLLKTEGAN